MTDWNGDGNYDVSDSYIDYQLQCGDDSDSGGSGCRSGGGGNNNSNGGCLIPILVYVGSMVLIGIIGGADSLSDYAALLFFPFVLYGIGWFLSHL